MNNVELLRSASIDEKSVMGFDTSWMEMFVRI